MPEHCINILYTPYRRTPDFTTKSGVLPTFTAKTKLPQSHSGDIQATNVKIGDFVVAVMGGIINFATPVSSEIIETDLRN